MFIDKSVREPSEFLLKLNKELIDNNINKVRFSKSIKKRCAEFHSTDLIECILEDIEENFSNGIYSISESKETNSIIEKEVIRLNILGK